MATAYQKGGVSGFMRAASGQGHSATWQAVERYARAGGAGKKLVNDFLGQLGPVGRMLGTIVGNGGQKPTLPGDLKSALDFVRAFSDQPAVIQALQQILDGSGAQAAGGSLPRRLADSIARTIEAAESGGRSGRGTGNASGGGSVGGGRGGRGAGEDPPGGGAGGGGDDGRVPINVDGQVERLPRNHPLVTGEMIETPQSSNVHSFGFDNDTHSLFVRFKDSLPSSQQSGYRVKSVYGGSGHGRPHKPGPLYLYHNCPARLFLTFIDADSKGNWVWDNLRIRGTVSGHQLDYALVGVQGAYVPRKATLTPAGEEYIPRTIFTDKGRSLSSPLPQELIRPLVPVFPGGGDDYGGGLGRRPNDGRGGLGGGRRR